MNDKLEPLKVFLSAFAISSIGGVAALLRSHHQITLRALLTATLYSGLMGLIIALLWYNYFDGQGNIYFLLGISGLAGIGGTTVLDFIVQVIRQGGLTINISAGDNPPDDREG